MQRDWHLETVKYNISVENETPLIVYENYSIISIIIPYQT